MNLCNNDYACPVCGRPMRLLTTIRHVPDEQTLVLQYHACGYALANKGHYTRAIEGWLGHRSIISTAVYTALAPIHGPLAGLKPPSSDAGCLIPPLGTTTSHPASPLAHQRR